MRHFLIIFLCFISLQVLAQEQQLAYQYFRNGAYKKASVLYENLLEKHPYNSNYLKYLIDCYQQLDEYDLAETIIKKQLEKLPNQDHLYVELGYNFQLQHMQSEANSLYEKALKAVEKSANLGFAIGRTFQDNHLLDYALLAYKKAMELKPSANYNFQIAKIYGEKADLENMFRTYLNMIEMNPKYLPNAKNYIGRYITEDSENETNILLKKQLLKRSQNNPQNFWNEMLSWLYIQQKDFGKALIQEKALHKRNPEDLTNLINVGEIAFNNKDYSVAKDCFSYVLQNSNNPKTALNSKLYLLQINLETNSSLVEIEDLFQQLFQEYGKNANTINVQVIYAEFVAFKKNNPNQGIELLKESLQLPLNEFQKGYIKTTLADILVFTNRFNTALIYYTQVQTELKNHEIGQMARFKIAQTSYFKGDFEWAQTQLKVLKNSTSQLIANDALDLNLLITDNIEKDSLKVALKKYATAELLSFQNKNESAIDTLQTILKNFKGHSIEDEALFQQAQLLEGIESYEMAAENYLQIIELDKDDILVDDAHYYLAELYLNKLERIEKAKEYYQKIIFDYPSSIYLVDSRKKYRKLRGDAIN